MRHIAVAAGMGKSNLYDDFTTKDDILLFLLEDMVATLTEQARAVAASSLAPDVRIQQFMVLQISFLRPTAACSGC